MSTTDSIKREIEKRSKEFYGIAVLKNLKDLDSHLVQYYVISDRIKQLLGTSLKVDRRLHVHTFAKKTEENPDNYIDFVEEFPDDIYTYRVKEHNIWVSSIFIKEIINMSDIVPDELFKL